MIPSKFLIFSKESQLALLHKRLKIWHTFAEKNQHFSKKISYTQGWVLTKCKTKKATGFKSLRLNCWNITQAHAFFLQATFFSNQFQYR